MASYEALLSNDPGWALNEGSRHFEERSAVHESLRRITNRLNELGIPYAVSGGNALFFHGVRRFTEDVDILLTREGLTALHAAVDGLGYVPIAKGKNLRDAQTGVRIDFIITGAFPGDGLPKPVAFPHPAASSTEHGGIRYLNLAVLIELKLASGMTNPGRLRDLSDVLELIRVLRLPEAYADQLTAYVRAKFAELHAAAGWSENEE